MENKIVIKRILIVVILIVLGAITGWFVYSAIINLIVGGKFF